MKWLVGGSSFMIARYSLGNGSRHLQASQRQEVCGGNCGD